MMGRMLNRRGFGDPVIENGARLGEMKVHFYRTLDKGLPSLDWLSMLLYLGYKDCKI